MLRRFDVPRLAGHCESHGGEKLPLGTAGRKPLNESSGLLIAAGRDESGRQPGCRVDREISRLGQRAVGFGLRAWSSVCVAPA